MQSLRIVKIGTKSTSKSLRHFIILSFIAFSMLQSCTRLKNENQFAPLNGGLRFMPQSNCLYPDSIKRKLAQLLDQRAPYDFLVVEARKLIAKDTALMARDSLFARVRVVVTSAVGGFGARVNGIEIGTSEKKIPLFPDSICFWINAYGTQGNITGSIFINGKKKDFEFKDYEPMTDATVKFSLKDFKEALPRKKKPAPGVPLVPADSVIARK